VRNDFEPQMPLIWQIELTLGTAATLVSAAVVLVICALIQHVANQGLEAVASMQAGATAAHVSVGALWPVWLGLFIVMSICMYCVFRQAYTNLLNRFSS
jgi:hypothetical protein